MDPTTPQSRRTPNRHKLPAGMVRQLTQKKPGRPPRLYDRARAPPDESTPSPPPSTTTATQSPATPRTPTPGRTSSATNLSGLRGLDIASSPIDRSSPVYPSFSVLPQPMLREDKDAYGGGNQQSLISRSLHNGLSIGEETTTPDVWLANNRLMDIPTPGITYGDRFLNNRRIQGDGEEQYTTKIINLDGLPRFFDELVSAACGVTPVDTDHQKHDYNVKDGHTVSKKVVIQWQTPSGMRPSDIRSRLFRLHLRDSSDRRYPDKIVWRTQFQCDGSCMLSSQSTISGSIDSDQVQSFVLEAQEKRYRSRQQASRAGPSGKDDEEEEEPVDLKRSSPNLCSAKLIVSHCLEQRLSRPHLIDPLGHDKCRASEHEPLHNNLQEIDVSPRSTGYKPSSSVSSLAR